MALWTGVHACTSGVMLPKAHNHSNSGCDAGCCGMSILTTRGFALPANMRQGCGSRGEALSLS
ncbi:hypothetical protein FH972_026561 [Carpinus fangiana]|uniref:Uncharacterized protein n=1 Tax=Carpinus fangiana TaxID=176857 RepID=A0A5N6L6V6_9ROSI|nr:hypothetical protein FH972_026561 [Carpinus fangiana]